jgi:hypothetical protein
MLGNFGNGLVPQVEATDLNLDKIHRGINKTQADREDKLYDNQKKLRTSTDLIASINRRYNKFKYAYYNKGVEKMDKVKITKCFNKTKQFLQILNRLHRKMIADGDPRSEKFGKKIAEVHNIVQKYGAYVIRLNESKCKNIKPTTKGKVQRNRNKIRK